MTIENFDYKKVAEEILPEYQALIDTAELIPDDKKYISELLNNYCLMTGEALNNDSSTKLDASQATLVCKFIVKFIFKKFIEFTEKNLPVKYREEILQKTAFIIFEVAKDTQTQNLSEQIAHDIIAKEAKDTFEKEIANINKIKLSNLWDLFKLIIPTSIIMVGFFWLWIKLIDLIFVGSSAFKFFVDSLLPIPLPAVIWNIIEIIFISLPIILLLILFYIGKEGTAVLTKDLEDSQEKMKNITNQEEKYE